MSKFPFEVLQECVYPYTKAKHQDTSVIMGSTFGEDVALTEVGGDILLSHVDPIVGAISGIGWLAMHVACNDIACSGIRPRWAQILLLVPSKEDHPLVKEIMSDAAQAAEEIGVTIVGGHTGYSSGISRPVVAVTAMAPAMNRRIVKTGGAEPGDDVIITGGAGIEGTSILATDFREEGKFLGLTDEEIKEAALLAKEVSVVKEAMILAENGATSMHDVTRGGIMETTMEIARLSGVSLAIDAELVPSHPIVERFAQAFSFDPLKMISSGSLVCTMPPENTGPTLLALEHSGIPAARAGKVTEGQGLTISRKGKISRETELHCEEDELARMWVIHKER
jgi:hydrogenase expression/formation protein HypE